MNPLILMPKSLLPLIIVHGCAAVFFWGWVIGECFIPRGERRDRSRWSRLTYAAAYFCLFAPIFFSWAKRVRFYDQRYDVAFYLNKEIVDRAMDAQIKVKAAKQFLTDEEMGYTPDVLTDEEMGYTPPPRRTR
jgi:hypothetical protein